ncbi:MAG: tRNA pseudouridine(38-40) synthase TruA [Chitinispirillaceae bacterium]|nr:tRNA pseudouridine(38-40) synthase TruA [Chitinispirillaceae bacterium]
MRYFCRVAYDGTPFGGWQRQPGARSIQQLLDEKAAIVLRRSVSFTGAGRTDAGVHARAQGAHFDYDGAIDGRRFTASMNALLPEEVAIDNVKSVVPSFHARFSALRRRYRYYLCRRKSPLLTRHAWPVSYHVDWGKIMTQVPALLGAHDFSAFCASGNGSATAVCIVSAAGIEREGECMVFFIEADRFVYKMVRSIVGTLIDIGRGKRPLTLKEVLDRGERALAGTTAPPYGLVLEEVVYAEV